MSEKAHGRILGLILSPTYDSESHPSALTDLAGVPMVVRVAQRVSACAALDDVRVIVPSHSVGEVVKAWGFQYDLTPTPVAGGLVGSIIGIMERYPDVTSVALIEGNQPMVEPSDISCLVADASSGAAGFTSLVTSEADTNIGKRSRGMSWAAFSDSLNVVALWSGSNTTLHTPDKSDQEIKIREHLGIYALRRDRLAPWLSAVSKGSHDPNQSPLQIAVENELPIQATICKSGRPYRGVHTIEDVARLRTVFATRNDLRFVL